MSYNQYVDGYVKEATYGTLTTILDGAGDTVYLAGALSQENVVYNIVTTLHRKATSYNVKELTSNNDTFKGKYTVTGMWPMVAQNGIPVWMALGASSTAGAGPYTHTITPTTDGTKIPSFAIYHEAAGSGTTLPFALSGMKCNTLLMRHDFANAPFLMYRMDWLGRKAEKLGFSLTNKPALPATANTDEYSQLTRTYNSVSIEGLTAVEVYIHNGLTANYAHTYDTGTYTGMWNWGQSEAPEKDYRIALDFHPHTLEDDMFNELVATGNDYTAVFKWQRSANDYIQVTATGSDVIEGQLITPVVGTLEVQRYILRPRQLSVEVKDSIAGGAYGE